MAGDQAYRYNAPFINLVTKERATPAMVIPTTRHMQKGPTEEHRTDTSTVSTTSPDTFPPETGARIDIPKPA